MRGGTVVARGRNSPRQDFQEETLQAVAARDSERFLSSDSIWQRLYFNPLPHQQGSFRPGFLSGILLPPYPKILLILSMKLISFFLLPDFTFV